MYIGMFLYIHGMVEDLKMRILSINADFLPETSAKKQSLWLFYVREIDLNVQIIKLIAFSYIFSINKRAELPRGELLQKKCNLTIVKKNSP